MSSILVKLVHIIYLNRQKRAYRRRHKKSLIKRGECCYKIPYIPNTETVDPSAILWFANHHNNQGCLRCPYCVLLPALQKLYDVCSHASMIQLKVHPDHVESGEQKRRAEFNLSFAKQVLTPDILTQMPGESCIRSSSILVDHCNLSGKMNVLDLCLRRYAANRDRVLLFSFSTISLDFIQEFVKEKGYTHLRLDGSTPTKNRQSLIHKFQNDNKIFLFLISTKAGGLGLNLTAANRVIIYDVNCK